MICIVAFPARAEIKTLQDCLDLGLPVIYIITDNGEDPPYQAVPSPEGCLGTGCISEKISGSVIRYAPDGTEEYNSGEYVEKTSGMTVKVRGNSSALLARKPFKIKLQKKADLLNRGDKKYKDKNWNLINDKFLFNFMGHKVAESIGQDWTPAGEFVNVMFNGDFRGTYFLIEAVEQNEDCRVNVSDDGFIAEFDPYWWNENGQYILSSLHPACNFTFKFPDWEDISGEQMEYISAELSAYEKSLKDGTYDEHIDCKSFARWFLTHDILGNADAAGTNFFLCKYDNTPESKFKLTPAWDFDGILQTPGTWGGPHRIQFPYLFTSPNKAFLQNYVDTWTYDGWDTYDRIKDILTDMYSDNWAAYNRSIAETVLRWNDSSYRLSTVAADKFSEWFDARFPWLEEEIQNFGLDSTPTGVDDVIPEEGGVERIYDLHGRVVIHPQPGSVYIRNGKKFISR